jgi:hypothetical protein
MTSSNAFAPTTRTRDSRIAQMRRQRLDPESRRHIIMNLMLWPGKRLDLAEETWLRNRISSLQRAEDARAQGWESARKERLSLERYIPEHDGDWTADQLEGGAHIGPWCDMPAATVSLNEPS